MENCKRILIADDNDEIKSLLGDFFVTKNCIVEFASNGTMALELAQNEEFDIIISDIHMPSLDGFELLDALKKALRRLPAVYFISGYTELDEHDLQSRGAKGLLTKPFHLDHLNNIINLHSTLTRHP